MNIRDLAWRFKLLRGLFDRQKAYIGPRYVTISLTQRCNLRCLGCRYHSPYVNADIAKEEEPLDLSFPIFERVCAELRALNTRNVLLAGEGEPFLYPLFLNAAAVLKKSKFNATVLTNGTQINEINSEALISSNVDELVVSLWSGSSQGYELNHPGVSLDQFQDVVGRISLLARLKGKRKRPRISLFCPIDIYNYKDIEEFTEIAVRTNSNAVYFAPFVAYFDTLSSFSLSFEQESIVRRSLLRVKRKCKLLSIGNNVDRTLMNYVIGRDLWRKMHCYAPWFHAYIRSNATVSLCGSCNSSLGDLKDRTFYEIWNGEEFSLLRKKALTVPSGEMYNCRFCCHAVNNFHIHRMFSYFA